MIKETEEFGLSINSKSINLNNRIYFHYCSVETFKNIINSKVFWLSNLTESNDEEEVSRTYVNLRSAGLATLFNTNFI